MRHVLIIPLVVLAVPIVGIIFINNYYANISHDTIVEGVIGQPRNVNPLRSNGNPVDEALVSLLYKSLFKYDVEGNFVPDLAERYEVTEDSLNYTVFLKQDRHWQDGAKITADDVVFTARKHPLFSEVKIRKLDDYAVQFTIPEVYSPFTDLLTIPIAPEHKDIDAPLLSLVGSGDYRIKRVNLAPNFIESITLERVQRSKGGINVLVQKYYNDSDELETAVYLGEIDFFSGDPFSWRGFETTRAPLNGINYAVFINIPRGGLLADIDFRRDLAGSTPKDYLVREVLGGRYEVIDSPITTSWAEEEDIDIYPYAEPETAKYSDKFTFVVPRTQDNIATAEMLKENWENLGLTIDLKVVESDVLDEKVLRNRDFDLLLLGEEVGHDPDRYSYWHSTQVDYPGMNVSGFKQIRVDKALEKGRHALEQSGRLPHYLLFQKLISADVPAIFLYKPVYFINATNKLKGLDLRDVYDPVDRYKSIDQWRIELP